MAQRWAGVRVGSAAGVGVGVSAAAVRDRLHAALGPPGGEVPAAEGPHVVERLRRVRPRDCASAPGGSAGSRAWDVRLSRGLNPARPSYQTGVPPARIPGTFFVRGETHAGNKTARGKTIWGSEWHRDVKVLKDPDSGPAGPSPFPIAQGVGGPNGGPTGCQESQLGRILFNQIFE